MTGQALLAVKEGEQNMNTTLIRMLNHVVSHSGMVSLNSVKQLFLLVIGFVIGISRRNTWWPNLSQF